MAWEMSPMRAPGPAAAIPAASARSVVLDQRLTLSGGWDSPTMKLMAASASDTAPEDGEVEGQQVTVGQRVVVMAVRGARRR